MKKSLLLLLVFINLVPAVAWSGKTTYIATNHRFNFVKLREVKPSVADARAMTHPAIIDEQGLRSALASLKLERSFLIKKEAQTQEVFNESAINFLAPNFVRAFKQAGALEEVSFSYLMKNPHFIVRDDRVNIGTAWVHGDELHIKFEKLYAKVTGDTDKRGGESRAIARSRGLRVRLELGPGQQMGPESDEVSLNMHYNYALKPEIKEALPDVTMAGEKVEKAEEAKAKAGPDKGEKAMPKGQEVAGAGDGEGVQPAGAQTVKGRLEALEQLKKDGLITGREYKEKRKEILKGL